MKIKTVCKGVVLAGGTGSRLYPCTRVTNKHLLPVYDQPMIYFPLQTLLDAGVRDILIVSGTEHAGDFLRLLGSGKEFGARFTYEIQDNADGIADALRLAEDFVDGEKFATILGDNLYEDRFGDAIRGFLASKDGMHIFLKRVPDNHRFGVPTLQKGRVVEVTEKPRKPASPYAITGLYLLEAGVFEEILPRLKKSARGEYEITDVMRYYIRRQRLGHTVLKGFWSDAGTFPSLYRATVFVRKKREQGPQNKVARKKREKRGPQKSVTPFHPL